MTSTRRGRVVSDASCSVLYGRGDAIAQWRVLARLQHDAALDSALSHAQGAEGYWAARHRMGSLKLAQLQKKARAEWVSPSQLATARFAAGDTARALGELERMDVAANPRLHNLTCQEDIDEGRESPRFKALVKRIGPLYHR